MKINKQKLRLLLLLAILVIAVVIRQPIRASDHDDGVSDSKGQNVNLTDLYAFREIDQNSQASEGDLILIMNTNPRSLPRQQYYFSPNAHYELCISRVKNNDDMPTGKHDVTLRFEFGTPNANGQQPMTVTALQGGATTMAKSTTRGDAIVTTPLNTNPILNKVALGGSNLTVFAGLREDPFFFDVEQFFRVRAGALGTGPAVGFRNPGFDFTAGYNVNSIVVRVPHTLLQGTSEAKTFDVWACTLMKKEKKYVQVDRLARPGINEGLITTNDYLNAWNSISPDQDFSNAAGPVREEAVRTLKALGSNVNDIVARFLPDVMRIDTTVHSGYAAAVSPQKKILVGGRMIKDPVMAITLTTLTQGAIKTDNVSYDGPNAGGTSHKPTLPMFPYLPDPN